MKSLLYGTALALAVIAAPAVRAQDNTAPAPIAVPAPAKTAKTISLDFKDMPIREAVQALFSGTGLNYAVTPDAAQAAPTVTLNLQDVSFDAALNILTKTAGLRFRKDRDTGVYMIEAKTVDTGATPVGGGGLPTDTSVAPDVAPQLQIEKIPLNFAASMDIYGTLYGQGSNSAARNSSSGGGSSFGGGGSSFGGGGSSFGGGGSSFGGGGSSFGGGGSSFGSSGGGFGGFGR